MTRLTGRPLFNGTIALKVVSVAYLLCASGIEPLAMANTHGNIEQEHAITIDATSIVSQSWWQVPGVTPSIWTSDPETSDAYRTSDTRVLQLKPGQYKFISFTFDFPFDVTPEGTVAYAPTLDQCVEGRGTHTLIVRCKRTYPHGGQPEYRLAP